MRNKNFCSKDDLFKLSVSQRFFFLMACEEKSPVLNFHLFLMNSSTIEITEVLNSFSKAQQLQLVKATGFHPCAAKQNEKRFFRVLNTTPIEHQENLLTIIPFIPLNNRPEYKYNHQCETSRYDATALHVAAGIDNSEILITLLNVIPTDELEAALFASDDFENTPLHIAAYCQHKTHLKLMLEKISSEKRSIIVMAQNDKFNTVFEIAHRHGSNFLSVILATLTDNEEDDISSFMAESGSTEWIAEQYQRCMHCLESSIDEFITEFSKLHELHRVGVLKYSAHEKYNNTTSLLHFLVARSDLTREKLQQVFSLLPEKWRYKMLNKRNAEAMNLLHMVTYFNPDHHKSNIEVFSTILDFYPENERPAALMTTSSHNRNLLHIALAVLNTELFKAIFYQHPSEQRQAALAIKNAQGNNVTEAAKVLGNSEVVEFLRLETSLKLTSSNGLFAENKTQLEHNLCGYTLTPQCS